MKKISIKNLALGLAVIMFVASCKKDSTPAPTPIVVPDQSFSQSFETLAAATSQGWVFRNMSDQADPTKGWRVRATTDNGMTPFDGTRLLSDTYEASSGFTGNISDWAISPKLLLKNGDKISFYTWSHGSIGYGAGGSYGDRLQLRLNMINTSDSIGKTSTDIGYFTIPLLDVNPLYKVTGPGDYPKVWTKYEATITGLNKPDSGRFAIRYFVELQGGANGDELAIDKVEFKSGQ